ncbi:hypothetical protein J437_LFUL017235 [Ladona fulva]|uniref:Tc1-like transposase DDE domain-containing protein n=1 Tax=Ladona fulva TaxID=123851 RepID=A0A8K0KRU0_LADFU|nr:hypothetical protein J437_LFUL017235 [Ladona fulva]
MSGGGYPLKGNSHIHTCKEARKWFEENSVKKLSWPARSPDLNPTENIWGTMARDLRQYARPPDKNKLLESKKHWNICVSLSYGIQLVISNQ